MAALLSGETDLLLDPPPQDIDRVSSKPQFEVVKGPEHRRGAALLRCRP
jgi:peptide/nickel transport system substrate-binding protein